jgi:hypothetical protein
VLERQRKIVDYSEHYAVVDIALFGAHDVFVVNPLEDAQNLVPALWGVPSDSLCCIWASPSLHKQNRASELAAKNLLERIER